MAGPTSKAGSEAVRRRCRRVQAVLAMTAPDGDSMVWEDLDSFASWSQGRSNRSNSWPGQWFSRSRWHCVLLPMAQILRDRMESSRRGSGDSWSDSPALESAGLMMTCSEADISSLLNSLCESMDLPEEDTAHVLLTAFHFLRQEDVRISDRNWRALLVTAIQTAIRPACGDGWDGKAAECKLLKSASHWWPWRRADEARKVFTAREAFGDGSMSKAQRLARFRELCKQAGVGEEDTLGMYTLNEVAAWGGEDAGALTSECSTVELETGGTREDASTGSLSRKSSTSTSNMPHTMSRVRLIVSL